VEEAPLPAGLRRHLYDCPDCRRRWHLLQQLDERVRNRPIPPAPRPRKEELLARLPPRAVGPRARWRLGATVLAASLPVAVGWGWVAGPADGAGCPPRAATPSPGVGASAQERLPGTRPPPG